MVHNMVVNQYIWSVRWDSLKESAMAHHMAVNQYIWSVRWDSLKESAVWYTQHGSEPVYLVCEVG